MIVGSPNRHIYEVVVDLGEDVGFKAGRSNRLSRTQPRGKEHLYSSLQTFTQSQPSVMDSLQKPMISCLPLSTVILGWAITFRRYIVISERNRTYVKCEILLGRLEKLYHFSYRS